MPTSADDVVVTAGSGSVTINVAAVCNTIDLDITGYLGVVTGATGQSLTASGAVVRLRRSSRAAFVAQAGFTINMIRAAGCTFYVASTCQYADIVATGASLLITAAVTVTNLTMTVTAAATLTLGGNLTVTGTLTLTGSPSPARLLVTSSVVGSRVTITAGTVACTCVDWHDIAGAGAANWDLSAITGGSGDCGGNSGITFTPSATQTWQTAVGGNWSDAANWTSRVPLPQDDVSMACAFSAGATVTANMPRLGRSIDWTGATWTGTAPKMTLSTSPAIYGSLTLISGMATSGGYRVTFRGRGASTLTCAGKFTPWSMALDAPGGSLTLQDALTSTGHARIGNGELLNPSNYTVSLGGLYWLTGTGGVDMGSASTWYLTNGTSDNLWDLTANNTGKTIHAIAATISITDTSGSAKTFVGGGLTYGAIKLAAGGAGAVIFTGPFAFSSLTLTGTGTKTVRFYKSTTCTMTGTQFLSGTAGNLVTIASTEAGSAFTLSKASGVVSCDYLSLQDSAATGGARWCAGRNSTDAGGNSGWLFRAPGGMPLALLTAYDRR